MSFIRYETDLVLAIVEDNFGPILKRVSACLITHGKLTLSELLQYTSLPYPVLRNALLSLIQHGIIYHDYDPFMPEKATFYALDALSTLMRIRYPLFLQLVEAKLGFPARLLLMTVMKYGRISIDDAVRIVHQQLLENQEEGVTLQAFNANTLRKSFIELVVFGGVQLVAECTPSGKNGGEREERGVNGGDENVVETEKEKGPAKRGRPSKSGAKSSAENPASKKKKGDGSIEKQIAARTLDVSEEWGGGDTSANLFLMEKVLGHKILDEKKKRGGDEEGDMETAFEAIEDKSSHLLEPSKNGVYKINHQNLTKKMCLVAAETFLKFRFGLGPLANQIIIVLCDAIDRNSGGLTAGELWSEIQRLEQKNKGKGGEQGKGGDKATMIRLIEWMSKSHDQLIQRNERRERDGTYLSVFLINLDKLRRDMKLRILCNAVRARHGHIGLRTFNFLMETVNNPKYPGGKIDDKIIGESCLLPGKVVRSVLFSLLASNFIETQDVSRNAAASKNNSTANNANNSANSANKYLFFVRLENSAEKLLSAVYKTVWNLKVRSAKESSRLVRILQHGNHKDSVLERLLLAEDHLDLYATRLDETLLVLRDF